MQNDSHTLDRRSRRTRKQLKEALFALILEKGYDAVKIEDITERADLGRTTFYLHYKDKDELLVESINTIADELIARLPPAAYEIAQATDDVPSQKGFDANGIITDPILVVFEHAAEQAQLYQIILRGEGARQTQMRLREIISQKAGEIIGERIRSGKQTAEMRVPVAVFANYLAGSLMAMVTWWLEANMPYPPEEMSRMYRQMFFRGGRWVLGLE